MNETVIHQWAKPEPEVKIKLERGQKGTYAWEISYSNESPEEAMRMIKYVDAQMRVEYRAE